MMRWSSTKTYTEEDILRMQQEAVTRVHEFQTRAKSLPFYDVPESQIVPYYDPIPTPALQAPTSYPVVDFPPPVEDSPTQPDAESSDTSTQPDSFSSQPSYEAPYMPPTPAPTASDPFGGLLSKLNLDGETLLIMGLLFLLYNEKADHSLLLAVAYLLL